MQTCHDLIVKHGLALQRSLAELDANHADHGSNPNPGHHSKKQPEAVDRNSRIKAVNERATLFKITSTAMINASAEFIELCQGHGRKWQKLLTNERENRQRLEDMVEQLAKQHSHLENMVRKETAEHDENKDGDGQPTVMRSKSPTSGNGLGTTINSDDDEELFEDAIDDETAICFHIPVPPTHRRTSSEESHNFKSESSSRDHDELTESEDERKKEETFNVVQRKINPEDEGQGRGEDKSFGLKKDIKVKRRSRIPDRPNISFSLWSIMKNCIGKDLSRIPIPVNFSEPLSMLQRITEDFEYADIIGKFEFFSKDSFQGETLSV